MKEYRLVMQTTATGITWEYTFHEPSNNMALQYAVRIINPHSLPQSCMAVNLYNITDDQYVARITPQPSFTLKVDPPNEHLVKELKE